MSGSVKVVKDSDGIEHRVAFQSESMSCGPAAVHMAECLVKGKKVDAGEGRIKTIGAMFPGSLLESNLMVGVPGGNFGSNWDNLVKIINFIGLSIRSEDRWNSVSGRLPGSLKAGLLGSRSPALVLIGWYVGKKRVGGHFVVATRATRKGNIVYLDPWDGKANEESNNGRYKATGYLEIAAYLA